ncbi:ets DNA-binding protein pokkuri-like [Penaeus monodon]|uniref:ets DNA-binding protein pokkuri-like n=1 Tax=Penaeus monodon TaxID=6687 RepID=UPI0018A6F5E5|nr:ets DNA-binding protein pokkuri-like [Penaeus monodon]XP_047486967.1 ets DNA-binding protein pokkuri-like [Penaeus chinensis]
MRSDVMVEVVSAVPRPPTPPEEYPGLEEVPGTWLYQVHDLTLKTLRAREHAVKNTLPHDPRTWSRDDVHRWLHHVSEAHQLPRVFPERFLMNGKALCLMTLDMFVQRVPLGGKLLYKDFQLRLCNAMYA